jgi:hypothetical protein
MTETSITEELTRLREELEAMSQRVNAERSGSSTESSGEAEHATREHPLDHAQRLLKEIDAKDVATHLAHFLRNLGQDVCDSKPKALAASFVAGFIAGKMLSR